MNEAKVKVLGREEILAADDIRIELVQVPEWGGVVYIRTLSGTQRERYVESIRKVTGHGKKQSVEIVLAESGAKLAAQTICDEKGTLLFSEMDVKALGKKSSKALQRIIDAAAKLNGLDDEAEEEAKNVLASQEVSDVSSTGSQDTSARPVANSSVN
ncbi:MAG TPA: phage tail assembly chaperone [Terriglobales bacterium]